MTKIKEWKEKGYFLDVDWIRNFGGAIPSLIFISLRYPRLVLNANKACPDGPFTLKPKKLPYEIPDFKKEMKYCKSTERFLRPTHLCNPLDRDIIAMANKLGAFIKSDWDYAKGVFDFVNENIRIDFSSIKSDIETLHAGHGTCVDKMSLFISLCRCAGIPSRYILYSPQIIQEVYDISVSADPLIKKWYDSIGFFAIHGSSEVKIDGKWVPSDVSVDPISTVGLGVPIIHFGEVIEDKYLKVIGNTMRIEGLPYGLKFLGSLPFRVFAGAGRAINSTISLALDKGREILNEMSIEEYDKKIRKSYKPRWATAKQKATNVFQSLK